MKQNRRRGLVLAAALPSLFSFFLFKEIFISSLFFSSSPSSAESSSSPTSTFDARFTGRTMRVDLFHTGGPKGEIVALDRAVDDGPWPGSPHAPPRRDEPRDALLRGAQRTHERRPLFARLFLDVRRVGDDGRTEEGVAHVPRVAALPVAERAGPDRPVPARRHGRFPAALHGDRRPRRREPRSAPAARVRSGRSSRTGPPPTKLDLLMLGEGYAEKDLPKFHADVKKLVDLLFSYEPFKSPSRGLQRPRAGPPVAGERRPPARLEDLPAHAARPSSTGSSARSATSSRTTTARCARRPRPRRTTSSRSS